MAIPDDSVLTIIAEPEIPSQIITVSEAPSVIYTESSDPAVIWAEAASEITQVAEIIEHSIFIETEITTLITTLEP